MCKQQSFGLEVRPVVFVCICLHHGFSLIVYPDWQQRNSLHLEVRGKDLKISHWIKFKSMFFLWSQSGTASAACMTSWRARWRKEGEGGKRDFLLRAQLSRQSVFPCCLLWTHNFQDLHIIRMLRRWPSERRQFYRTVNISCTNCSSSSALWSFPCL